MEMGEIEEKDIEWKVVQSGFETLPPGQCVVRSSEAYLFLLLGVTGACISVHVLFCFLFVSTLLLICLLWLWLTTWNNRGSGVTRLNVWKHFTDYAILHWMTDNRKVSKTLSLVFEVNYHSVGSVNCCYHRKRKLRSDMMGVKDLECWSLTNHRTHLTTCVHSAAISPTTRSSTGQLVVWDGWEKLSSYINSDMNHR